MKFESNTNCMFETEPGYNILQCVPCLTAVLTQCRNYFCSFGVTGECD